MIRHCQYSIFHSKHRPIVLTIHNKYYVTGIGNIENPMGRCAFRCRDVK